MKKFVMAALFTMLIVPAAQAVTMAEDLATTIRLRGFECGSQVSNINEHQDAQGNRIIQATCANGVRYQITVTPDGRMRVRPL